MVTAVIFDMDGVILDSERIILNAWISTVADYGQVLEKGRIAGAFGGGKAAARAILEAELGTDFPFEKALPEVRNRIRRASLSGWPLKPGIRELLDGLAGLAVPLAVATSTYRAEAESRLVSVSVDPYFDVICGGDDVAEGKPSPAIYLLTAQRLEMSPSQCIVIEDSETGVLSAYRAGMRIIHIPDLAKPSPASRRMATQTFDSAVTAMDTIIRMAVGDD